MVLEEDGTYTVAAGSVVVRDMAPSLIAKNHRAIGMREKLIRDGDMVPVIVNGEEAYQVNVPVPCPPLRGSGNGWTVAQAFCKGSNGNHEETEFIPFHPSRDNTGGRALFN